MATAIPPDVAMVVGRYLRAHPAVRALVGSRVVSRTPTRTETGTAWVQIRQIGGASATGSSSVMHLIAPLIDVHCYAGSTNTQEEASRVARTVAAALCDMAGVFPADGVVITGVPPRSLTQPLHLPDPDVANPSRERYVLTAIVYGHAT